MTAPRPPRRAAPAAVRTVCAVRRNRQRQGVGRQTLTGQHTDLGQPIGLADRPRLYPMRRPAAPGRGPVWLDLLA